LGEPARELLLRLSVLPDGAGAAVVTAILGRKNWDDAAEELVAASVWRLDWVQEKVHPTVRQRYTLHPLVRQFALEELGAGRADAERNAALAMAALLKGEANRGRFGSADFDSLSRALDWCQVERKTLLAAANFAFQAGEFEAVYQIASTIFNFWKVRGYWSDAERLYEQTLEACRRTGNRAHEARTLNFLGNLSRVQGRLPWSEECQRQALALWREVGNQQGEGDTLKHLARVLQGRGDYAASEQVCNEALLLLRAVGDGIGEARTLVLLGNACRSLERWEEAERHYVSALALSRQIGDRYDEGDALNYLGHIFGRQSRWGEAEGAFQESLKIWIFFRDRRRQGITLYHWALLCQARGQAGEARARALAAVEVLQSTDDRSSLRAAQQLVNTLAQPH
jgi:tetratricopeptide (TPR) repeat protein